jgi:hypothetical protein
MVKADVTGDNTPSARVAQIKEALEQRACHVQERVRQLSEDIRELLKTSAAKP